nr:MULTISPECIES: hypothetical protein [Sphingobium]
MRQRVNLLHSYCPMDETGDSEERVDMDLIIVEKADLFQMRPGDEIEDVSSRAAEANDCYLYAPQPRSHVIEVVA